MVDNGNLIKFGGHVPIDMTLEGRLGVRGKQLAELAALEAHLVPGFIAESAMLSEIVRLDDKAFKKAMLPAMSHIEKGMEQRFGDEKEPLLIKVVENSMLNFVDTIPSIHHVGLNDGTIDGFAQNVGEEFAWNEYGHIVHRVLRLKLLTESGGKATTAAATKQMGRVIGALKRATSPRAIRLAIDSARPILSPRFFSDSYTQLSEVLKYCKTNFSITKTSNDSSVVVQAMVFGNSRNAKGGFGTMCTRNYITGEKPITGSYFQGEFNAIDRSKQYPIDKLDKKHYLTLQKLAATMEAHFKNIGQVNFTIGKGNVLWIIDQRVVNQRTAIAEVRMLLDLEREKAIDKKYLIGALSANRLSELLHPTLDINSIRGVKKASGGIVGAVGAAVGRVFFSTPVLVEAYRKAHLRGEDANFILAMPATFAEDVKAIELANGVISSEGGYASHAPVVARSLGKIAMINPNIIFKDKSMTMNGLEIKEGDYITVQAPYSADPVIYLGKGTLVKQDPQKSGLLDLIALLDGCVNHFRVRANADQPKDAEVAKMFGACGIGLCRTEHMFFHEQRINLFRSMIVAPTAKQRVELLKQLEKMQTNDFYQLLKIMDKMPVSIRLLDAPLHEFLPNSKKTMDEFVSFYRARYPQQVAADLRSRCDLLTEFNPMLGHRGVRLAFTYPEIYKMQVRAIFKAAYKLKGEGASPMPEIMIPLIMSSDELKAILNGKKIEGRSIFSISEISAEVRAELKTKAKVPYQVGTMIELPAAALSADKIAAYAEFFSFGTNDLTQTTHGLSRDDFTNFFSDYSEFDLLESNPFQILSDPVSELISVAMQRGRLTRPALKAGLCGEHGADPANVAFVVEAGLDYISCSPYGIPIAKLALAQYNLEHSDKEDSRS